MLPSHNCSDYHEDLFRQPRSVHQRVWEGWKVLLRNYDTEGRTIPGYIVGRGVSGIAPASVLAWRAHKRLIVVRSDTHTHSSLSREGEPRKPCGYIVVDDFIATGKTIDTVTSALMPHECVGVILHTVWPSDRRWRLYADKHPGLLVVPVFRR